MAQQQFGGGGIGASDSPEEGVFACTFDVAAPSRITQEVQDGCPESRTGEATVEERSAFAGNLIAGACHIDLL